MITVIEIGALGVIGFFLLYLAFLSILALLARTRNDFHTTHRKAFAVVVPAHNEELVIGNTLRSLLAMDYRKALYDVIVIADNCTDRTAAIARDAGAIVYERSDAQQKGKGYALRWCFDKILLPPVRYDAVVVVDADSVVSPNFLLVMNHYLDQGAKVLQASDIVQPQPGSWSPEVTRIALMLFNYVRPLGGKLLGFSAGLRGNGMCFSSDVLRTIPWSAYSITEDLEYGIRLLQEGIRVEFAPEAAVYARMPVLAKNAESQRARWESGRFDVIRTYAGKLLAIGVKKFSARYIAMFIELVMPAFVNMMVVATGFMFSTIILALLGSTEAKMFVVPWLVVVSFGILHVMVGLITAKADRAMYKAILYLPRYAVWKLFLYSKLLLRGLPVEWVRTNRK